MMARLAMSLPGSLPGGMVRANPSSPRRASSSICGVFCGLQRGFATQLGHGIVTHAVAYQNDVFHR